MPERCGPVGSTTLSGRRGLRLGALRCAALASVFAGCINIWPDVDPRFTVSPESFTFEVAVDDESAPEQDLRVDDPEGLSGIITVSADEPWVTITPMARLAYVGAPWHFSVGVTLDGLGEGTHAATITVRSERDGAEVLVPVALTIIVQAEGYVAICTGPIIIPRELIVGFEEGMSDAEMEAVIAATGSAAVSHTPGSMWYGIETPLGYSFQEIMDSLLSHPSVSSCSPDQGNFCGYSVYALMAEDGSGTLWPLAGGVDPGLEDVVLEYIVTVRGHEIDMGYLDVTSVDILRDRVLEKHGAITLVDRGSEEVVVILVENSGAAWELLGPVAEEIALLPDVDGKTATIHGCERPLSLTSRAGGLEFRVTSYDLADSRPEQPCSGTDTFEAVGVVRPAPQKWVTASGGRITHVLESIGFRVVVTGSVCDVHLDAIPEGTKLRLSAGSSEIADALAASEGRRVIVSGNLPHLRALWDSDGPTPPVGEVTGLQPLATSIEAYGDVVAASSVASLWGEGTVPPGATHALVLWIEMPFPPPPGCSPELPPYPFIVHYFLRPTTQVPDLSACEGLTVSVEGDLLGVGDNLTVGPRVIGVSVVAEVSEPGPDRISGAMGKVCGTSNSYYLRVNEIVTEYYLAADSLVDLASLVGTWVRVSGEVTGGYGSTAGQPAVSVLTLSVDSATAMPPEFDGRDHVGLEGWVGAVAAGDPLSPSAATHNLGKDCGPMLPGVHTAAHLRSEVLGLLEQWAGCQVSLEGTVDSWITWEGDQSFATLVNVTGVASPFEGIWLVDDDALPGGNGRSWVTAFQHPQDAVDAASAGEEVWIAAGTYTRRDSADTVLLTMEDGVALYGGFAGIETSRDARDWAVHETILDGEDAADHVAAGASDGRLDGFTVTGGSANEGVRPDYNGGGGMRNESVVGLTVANCTFAGNSGLLGGGMYNESSSLTVTSCAFTDNSAAIHGGGMDNYYCSSLEIVNCTFTGNSAFWDGGGMRSYDSSLTVTNCSFTNNSAGSGGGMLNCGGSSADVTNCILWGNAAPNGPEVYNDAFTSVSCVLTYSCIGQAGYTDNPDDHNINADPRFMDPANGDLHLSASSPCIDAGTADGAPDHDLEGNARPLSSAVDMGAYEWSCLLPPPPADVYAIPGPAEITIWWSPVPGAASYNVYLTFDGSLPSKLNGTKVESVTSAWVHQTALEITYRYVVTALNGYGESGESKDVGGTPWLITIPTLPPPEPLP